MPTESPPLASFSSVDLFWFCQFKIFTRRVPRSCSLGSFWFALGFMESFEFKGKPVTGPGVGCVFCASGTLQEAGAGFVSFGLSDFTSGGEERGESQKPLPTQNISRGKERTLTSPVFPFIQQIGATPMLYCSKTAAVSWAGQFYFRGKDKTDSQPVNKQIQRWKVEGSTGAHPVEPLFHAGVPAAWGLQRGTQRSVLSKAWRASPDLGGLPCCCL